MATNDIPGLDDAMRELAAGVLDVPETASAAAAAATTESTELPVPQTRAAQLGPPQAESYPPPPGLERQANPFGVGTFVSEQQQVPSVVTSPVITSTGNQSIFASQRAFSASATGTHVSSMSGATVVGTGTDTMPDPWGNATLPKTNTDVAGSATNPWGQYTPSSVPADSGDAQAFADWLNPTPAGASAGDVLTPQMIQQHMQMMHIMMNKMSLDPGQPRVASHMMPTRLADLPNAVPQSTIDKHIGPSEDQIRQSQWNRGWEQNHGEKDKPPKWDGKNVGKTLSRGSKNCEYGG